MSPQRGPGHLCLTMITVTILVRLSESVVVADKQSLLIKSESSMTNSRVVKRSTQHHYSWVFGGWTSCSQECGIGYQLRAVSCIEKETGAAVSPQLCPPNEVPARNQTCNKKACQISSTDEFKWIEGRWGECSVDCGIGEQTQTMHCIKTSVTGQSSYSTDDVCLQHVGVKPVLSRVCNGEGDDCSYWATGSWSECSVTCGFGIQTTSIYCQRDPEDTTQDPIVLDDSLCLIEIKPQQVQTCSLDPCADGSNNKIQTFEQSQISRSVVDCRASKFGCCQDNLTAAKGSSYFGCPDQVIAEDICKLPSETGSCSKYTVKWYFDAKEQVCLRFWYGGCQGNENRFDDIDLCETRCRKKAFKPEEKLARCYDSQYGCCEDGITSANGPRHAGCPEFKRHGLCSESKYGCCADGSTAAIGPNNKGCPTTVLIGGCAGTHFGCCDDGVTAARGKNRLGCAENQNTRCQTSLHGCCQDKVTPASGPNKEGCPEFSTKLLTRCLQSAYGCCPDNVSLAHGPKGEGCPSFDRASCEQPKHSGTCTNYTIHWHFETKSKSCRQFWYGGCGGNSNKFSSIEECEAKCGTARELVKTQACDSNPCQNGFVCQDHNGSPSCSCNSDWDQNCATPPEYWCFSQSECGYGLKCSRERICKHGDCKIYAKCVVSGRRNTCDTKTCPSSQDCVNDDSVQNGYFCENKISYSRPFNIVLGCAKSEYGCCPDQHTPAEGPHYQGCQQKCEVSTYGCCIDGVTPAEGANQEGCDFGSGDIPCNKAAYGCCADGITAASGPFKRGCGDTPDSENTLINVPRTTETTLIKDKCTAPMSGELCSEYSAKWRFDDQKKECVRHWWGGCRDNGNVFESQRDCEAECINTVVKVEEKCVAPAARDLCKEYSMKWRFDNQNQECVRFWWGGCQDNGNVFESQGDCEAQCMNTVEIMNPEIEDPDFVNICDMPKDVGPCTDNLLRHYYDPKDRKCRVFYYGGCQGNENNFVKIEDCQRECMPWDVRSGSLTTSRAPEPSKLTSGQVSSTTTESTRSNDPGVVCLMEAVTGMCKASFNRWFYDHSTGTCLQFIYGGCGGNSNNFKTVEQCNNYCNSREVCHQAKTVGPCRAAMFRFYFDSVTGSCQSFIYGGCQGNLNNFATNEACSRKCSHHKPIISQGNGEVIDGDAMSDVCQLNPEKGSCRGYNIMWYYSAARNQCSRFVYTGCDGNGNQFNSEKDCNDKCLKREDTDDHSSQVSTIRPVQTTILPFFHTKDHIYSKVTVQPGTSVDQNVIIVRPGIDAFLKCTLRGYEILWYRDGLSLSSSPGFQIYHNGTLVLRRVTEDMSGIYSCRISTGNNIPQLEKFKVEVYVPLSILPGPTLISTKPGDNAFFHCQAAGRPQPLISWNRNGKVLTFTNHHNVFGNGTLIINSVHVGDAGEYECTAENGVAPAVKRKINLNIKETIGVDIQRHQGIFTEGETIHLLCNGTGYPAPQLEWMKEGNILKSGEKVTVINGDLTIRAAAIEDAGMYKCIASNGKDKVQDVTAVQIKYQNLQTKCEDTMGRTKCQLIVSGKLCGLRIFAVRCCQSCRKARYV